ncbi:MAG: hypothetical protein RR320_02510, partial [Oscillospiraceae bacterium]
SSAQHVLISLRIGANAKRIALRIKRKRIALRLFYHRSRRFSSAAQNLSSFLRAVRAASLLDRLRELY